MLKLNWTNPKDYKISFPLNLTKFNYDLIFSNILLINEVYLFIFIDYEILIFSIDENKNEDESNINIKQESSNNNFNLIFMTKRKIDFISDTEDILYVLEESKKKDENKNSDTVNNENNLNTNFNILISTNLGNIFILNFDIKDFYFEITYNFNIRHNFIREYEILSFSGNNILMTIDKHLFLFEIHYGKNLTNNNKFSLIKNLILRIEDQNEKLIYAYIKPAKNYVIIFTNKFLHLIDFESDGMGEIIFKKDPKFYNNFYSGFVYNNIIYYVKDSNNFSIYPIYDKENKFTIKVSAKNNINELNFYKIINVNEHLITICNEKESELYFINQKFKLIHRENILFDKSFFLFCKNRILVINLNLINMIIKFKIGHYHQNLAKVNLEDKKDILDIYNVRENKQINLNNIEDLFIKNNQEQMRMKINFKIKYKEILNILKKCYLCNSVDNFIFLKEKFKKKLKKLVQFNLNVLLKSKFNNSNFFNNKVDNFILNLEMRLIKIFNIKFGEYLLTKNYLIVYKIYFKNLYSEKIEYLVEIANRIKDKDAYFKFKEILLLIL